MALSIKNPEAERLARELSRITGESLTEAVTGALRERLVRETGRNTDTARWLEEIREIQCEVARLPVLDDRTPDAIVGYDDRGRPG